MAITDFNETIDAHHDAISKISNDCNTNPVLTPILDSVWSQHHYANAVADLVSAKANLRLAQLTYAREIAGNL